MTNPNNLTKITTPVTPDKITAVAYYKPSGSAVPVGNLWLGAVDGSIYIAEDPHIFGTPFIIRCRMKTARTNFSVKDIFPVETGPVCTLVHWLGGNGQAGPVQVIYPGGIRVQVCDEATRLLFSSSRTKQRIAILSGVTVTFYSFVDEMLIAEKSVQLHSGYIEAISIGEDSLFYFSEGRYHQMSLNDFTDKKLTNSSVDKPFIVKVASKTFILGYKEFMLITGLKMREQEAMLQYDKTNRIPKHILIFKDIMYQFFDNLFTRQPIISTTAGSDPQVFHFKNVTHSCMVNDNLVIVTPTDVNMIGTVPQSSDLAEKIVNGQSEEVDHLLEKLPNEQSSEIISNIFDILWQDGKREAAFDLITRHAIVKNINKYVALTPILVIDVPDDNGDDNAQKKAPLSDLKPLEMNDKSYLEPMLKFLNHSREELVKNVVRYKDQIREVNTALAQCYASFSKTRELDELIKDNHLDLKPLQYFLKERAKILSLSPAYAVLQSNLGEADEAVGVWKKLDLVLAKNNKFNPMIISEASYAIQKLKDSPNLVSHLDWIYERDPNSPELAVNAILSVNHDPAVINKWILSKGLENMRLKYSVFIVTQSVSPKASTLANATFIQLLDILADIDHADFDLQRLQFAKCIKSGATGGILKLNAKKEILTYALKILELHADSINEVEAESHITENIDSQIGFALYRVKKMYDKALKMMTINNTFPEEQITEFCRLAPDPDVAFSTLLKMLDPADLIPKYKQFILNNLTYMNLPELVTLLPRDLRMKDVQLIVKKCYNLMHSRLYALDSQIAISKSMRTDMHYRKTRAQADFAALDKNTVCHKCGMQILEEQQCVMAPGGTNMPVYHPRCKPTLFT